MTTPANTEKPATRFSHRHIGPSPEQIQRMLQTVGAGSPCSMDELIAQAIPSTIRQESPLEFGAPLSETEALAHLRELAESNVVHTSLIGQGYSGTIVPAPIQRNILENPAWYTAYTPYQPEISQGRLEALINFQTMVSDLTGLDIANASLLDEATAAAEAMALARRVSSSKSNRFFVDSQVHPQTLAVIETRAEPLGWTVVVGDPDKDLGDGKFFGGIFQYPGTLGVVRDLRAACAAIKAQGGIPAVAADPLALTLLTPPGEFGAEIAIGSMQRFGVPLGYGGPHAAYMAVRAAHTRSLPGRLVGVSVDRRGTPAYRLTLQTREQHIRREKATSNICTAQVLLAVMASMYAVYHGPEGLKHIASEVHQRTATLAEGLRRLGYAPANASFFDTVTVEAGEKRGSIVAGALAQKINLRVFRNGEAGLSAGIGIALDETVTPSTVEAVWRAFGGSLKYEEVERGASSGLPAGLRRTSAFLNHPVFHRHRSEAALTRYMRKLADRDLALDRTMIPLGSCTMKLNATAEMIPIGFPGFANIHPFAPASQTKGYQRMFDDLERFLCAITGYDAVSFQPNSGAQGEYAGLLAIRAWHHSRGEGKRNVCLIPTSAHGTNPASAHMAGMEVVAVRCDDGGNVDIADLEVKAGRYADTLAAAMVTYPSTHGVFEEGIREFCAIVHRYGGQVYLDGANLNAQVGLCRPGDYGADVSHLNLHKTFCIPHGGGGPGMGPIGVKAHLKPFLPQHPLLEGGSRGAGAVSAAPFGSASILPIAYAYILMMGGDGLRQATETAILAANYVAARLEKSFPVLYRNANGRVAHECIVDPRSLEAACGVTVDDIAKRLIDYGFHAPTMSFPVAGTLMIEPTESEPLAELDRFCDAMISIREEIRAVEQGRFSIADSPLRHAPHTTSDLADEKWERPYSRAEACFPNGVSRTDKYWSPVNRIDHVYGDRNVFCVCPPVEDTE